MCFARARGLVFAGQRRIERELAVAGAPVLDAVALLPVGVAMQIVAPALLLLIDRAPLFVGA